MMYEDYSEHGFMAIAINLGDGIETVRGYARLYEYLHLLDNGTVWPVYRQSGGIPLNYVVDANGVIRYVAEGYNEAAVRQAIQQWLPDPIEHDVGVRRVLAPSGNFDSSQVAVPACSVYNYGIRTETYPVRMKIGTRYDTVAMVSDHAPGTARYVELPEWTALERGLLAITCSTELAGEDIRSNDKAIGSVTVRVYDLAVTEILAPPDSVDSAATVVPSAVVKNLGTIPDLLKAKFYIGDFYVDSISLPLHPGRLDTLNFTVWIPEELGEFPVRCTVSGRQPDPTPENNIETGTVRVVGAGVEEPEPGPRGFALYEARPNPTTGQTLVRYALPDRASVQVRVYAASGELVRALRSGVEDAGQHSVVWDGRDDAGVLVGRGIYYCRLETADSRIAKKLVKAE